MTPAAPRVSLWLGVAFMVAALWTLTLLDTAGKYMTTAGYHPVMVAWIRYTLNALLMAVTLAPVFRRRTGRSLLQSAQPRLQILRALVLLTSTILLFSTLKIVPLAETTAMTFCAPLIVLALSPWLLGEKPRLSRWVAVGGGFTGMLLVLRPGGGIAPPGLLLGILLAVTISVVALMNRQLNQRDDPLTTVFYGALVGMAGSSLLVPFFWTARMPTFTEGLVLLSLGISSTAGHFFLNTAYRHAEASFLTPFVYLQVVSATSMGWLVFGQLPDGVTAVGIAVICASGIGIAWHEHRRMHARQ